ncbi:Lon protease [Planctomycetota bacterium]|nr:Lon protease [Planctomycetota bacterium]
MSDQPDTPDPTSPEPTVGGEADPAQPTGGHDAITVEPSPAEKVAEVVKDSQAVPGPTISGTIRSVTRAEDLLPDQLVALPLNQRPMFPTMMLPLAIPPGRLSEAVQHAIHKRGGHVGFFLTREPLDDGAAYKFDDLLKYGVIGRITKHQEADHGVLQIFVQIIARFAVESMQSSEPVVLVRGRVVRPQVDAGDQQVRALAMAIVQSLKTLVSHNPVYGDEIKLVLANFNNLDGPGRLADISASLTTAKRDELQAILETEDVQARMHKVLLLLAKEDELAQLKTKIAGQIEQKVGEHQRKFFLNEQFKAIKQELGMETDEKSLDAKKLDERFAKRKPAMSAEARQVYEEELRKMKQLDPASAEYAVVRSRLEWLVDMPWGDFTADDLDLVRLRAGLDADHYGLEDVKDRIVEFCAVRRLTQEADAAEVQAKADSAAKAKKNPGKTAEAESITAPSDTGPGPIRGGGIIALVGPPGTGKTSIGASIARHLGRKFFRLSLGGMRDEAEIKGHRRTYVGALPGKMVQALKRCGSMNPVILLDEVDKLSHGHQGDPASALLEVLDPEQNKDFLDHYLDIRVDLSQVLFICTANELGGIPEPLRDRMEIIRLAGYVEAEKQVIAKDHLIPKQRKAHGLKATGLAFAKPAVATLIRDYAREAGVRHLEQLIAKICRKVATEQVKAGAKQVRGVAIKPADLVHYLGKPLLRDDELITHPVPGVVTGLAWTAMGGATLEVEAVATPAEKGGLTLTGQLGDVMKESAQLARSYLMTQAERLGLHGEDAKFFDRHHVHLHVPAGATPKDGPSAGVTMASALLSLAKGKATRRKLGMTGELTLTGRVYPIGGVREKLVAAKRSHLDLVLLPAGNERDYDELPELVRAGIEVRFVSHLDEVLEAAGLVAKPGR